MGWTGAAAAFVVGSFLSSQTNKPKTPALEQPAPPPQASKVPEASQVAAGQAGAGQAGGSPGVAQTFLTGPGGVDPSLLQLGKTTLLGG
jgi:hypothetical protein